MVNPILIGSVLGSTVAYLKKIGKIPYTLEEALEILMGHPIGDDVTWDNNEDNLGDEVTWNAAPQQTKVKFPRAKADKIVKKVEKHLKPYVVDMMACGSYRRGAQMIGDIDFVLILKPGYELPEVLPANEGINWVGNQKAQVIIDGEKVDFRVTTPDAWGATILYFTGPADFNIKYRWMAKKKGLKLSEYGLFDRNTGKYIAGKTENDIFTALGRPYKNPDVRKGFRAEGTEMYLHPHGGWGRQIDILEEFPNAKNFDALINQSSIKLQEEVKVLNSMEELLSKDSYGKLCYINFPLTVYRGVNLMGMKEWTWQRWLEDDKMGTSENMGIPDSQPTTLNIQEALDYARAGHPNNPNSDFELYAIDVQDYFVWLPRESQRYIHKNCNPKYQCLVCNRIVDYNGYKNPDLCSVKVANFLATEKPSTKRTYAEIIKNDYNNDLDKGMKDILGGKYKYLRCFAQDKFTVTCDNEQHLKTESTPVIFILGGARYEDLQVIWDSDVNLFFEAPYQPNQSLEDYSHQDLMTSSVVTGDFTTDSLKYGFGPTTLAAEGYETLVEMLNDIWNEYREQIEYWVENDMAGDGLMSYWDEENYPDGSDFVEGTTKTEYFDKMYQCFIKNFIEEAQIGDPMDRNNIGESELEIVAQRVLYVPVGTPINTKTLGNWETRKGDKYGVLGKNYPITSWLWSAENFYAAMVFGHEDIDHMKGQEGVDFDRILLAAWVPINSVDWFSTIAFNISTHWQERELCVLNQAELFEVDIYRNGVLESSLEDAKAAEERFYYHGTDAKSLASILEEGIKPTGVEDSVWNEELEDVSPHPYYYEEVDDFLPSVFVAETPEEARWWAEEADNTEIVVLKISSQVENLANFSDDGVGGWRTSETIPTNYIVDIISSETFEAEDNYEATYGKEQAKIRRRLKNKIMKQAIMGTKAGQWSARKSQELKRQYEAACEKKGLRAYKGNKTKSQDNLSKWSRQKWGTASGKKSSKTGEPYFPAKAIEALKDRGLYAKAKRQKQAATKAGKQHARYSDDIREVVKPFRSESFEAPLGRRSRRQSKILNEAEKIMGTKIWTTPELQEALFFQGIETDSRTLGYLLGIDGRFEMMGKTKTKSASGRSYEVNTWRLAIKEAESFVTLDIKDMDRFLRNRRFKPVDLTYRNQPVKEWVYERSLPSRPNHVVRVYTSINRYGRQQGRGRDVGRDAIRVQVIYRDAKGETLVSSPTRVHRIGTWEKNLDQRLKMIAEEKPQVVFDSRGEPMTLRKYKGKLFWGSRDYPRYKETKSI